MKKINCFYPDKSCQCHSVRVALSKSYFTALDWPSCLWCIWPAEQYWLQRLHLHLSLYIHRRALVTDDLISSAKMRLTNENFQWFSLKTNSKLSYLIDLSLDMHILEWVISTVMKIGNKTFSAFSVVSSCLLNQYFKSLDFSLLF